MGKHSTTISLLMPAFNEEDNLERVVLHNIKTFESQGLDFELLIIDDHSSDRTGEIGDAMASRHPRVRCYHHKKNLGAGGAVWTGINHSTKDYVIFAPFDNPLDPEDLEAYLPRMGICDIVVGVRVKRVGYPPFALFASFIYNRILIPLLFNLGVADVNWIQAYRRKLFSEGILKFKITRIFFLVEILIRARRNHLIIAEVPSKMRKRLHGKPTSTRLPIIWTTFWDMLSFFWNTRKENKTLDN